MHLAVAIVWKLVPDCYEQRSIMITTNLEFSRWVSIFGSSRPEPELQDQEFIGENS